MTIINNINELLAMKGQPIGESRWFEVSQEVINNFANSTFDHQWIHVDTERAKKKSPYGTTVAHGYLTLSLLPFLMSDILMVNNLKQAVNYGIKELYLRSVVPVGSHIKLFAKLNEAKKIGSICQTEIGCRIEIEGYKEPALDGAVVYLYSTRWRN